MIRSFNGKTPRIDPTAFVSEAAYVVGDVEIGPHSSIWPGVVIRGDMGRITIGSHTNIQDNSVVHSDTDATLGNHVTLGHSVVCHAAVVEDYSLLGNANEVFRSKITAFGEPGERHLHVHSLIARLLLFYGVFGLVVTTAFWLFYIALVRSSYLGAGMVAVLALTGLAKWTFHTEAYFIPVMIIIVLMLKERRMNQPEPWTATDSAKNNPPAANDLDAH